MVSDMLIPKILVIGQATLDVSVKFSEFPRFNSQQIGGDYQIHLGGTAINIAHCLHYMTASVTPCVRIGDDAAGAYIRKALESANIDLSLIRVDKNKQTSLSIINRDESGDVAILHYEGANNALCLADIPINEIKKYDMVHIGGAMLLPSLDGQPLLELATEVKRSGVFFSLTVARNTAQNEHVSQVLPFLDLIIMNEKESLEISKTEDVFNALKWFYGKGVSTTVITLGEKGAYVLQKGNTYLFPAFMVTPIDTLGCGDAFSAGYLYAFVRKMPTSECAKYGNMMGAYCATNIGAIVPAFDIENIIYKYSKNDEV
jgi:sugar/nucleoside kinase (ribokinase family)